MTLEITETPCGKVAPSNTSRLFNDGWPIRCLKPIGHDKNCQGRLGIWNVYWNANSLQGVFAHATDFATRKS